MTNDINTLNGSIQEAIDRLVANLQAMGIYDAEFDPDTGLFGLIDMVKMIAPSMTNIELDTSITCSCPSTASVGVPFNITGTLSASYDDTSINDVDLVQGRLSGATVEIYNGDTLLTTTTTDSSGNYTYAYTPLSTGTLSLKAVYDSSNDYYDDSASSSVSVTVNVDVSSLSLSVSTYDKNDQLISSPSSSAILSYVDEEYAVLTATALDSNNNPVIGETVSFNIIDQDTGEVIENIGTDVTDSNGIATVSYLSKHAGDLYIRAFCQGIFLSESYDISDIYWYDTSSSTNVNKYNTNNNTITYNSTEQAYYIKDTGANNTVSSIIMPNASFPNKVKITAKIKFISTSNSQFGIGLWDGSQALFGKVTYANSANWWGICIGTQELNTYGTDDYSQGISSSNFNTSTWYTLELIIDESNVTENFYNGNKLLATATGTQSILNTNGNQFFIRTGMYMQPDIYMKDIMIEPL